MLRRSSDDYERPHHERAHDEPDHPAREMQRHAVDLRELTRILRRRWQAVIAVPIALIVAAGIFIVAVTPLYTATSTVFIDPRRASMAESNNSQAQGSNFGTDDATIESQVLLIQSVAILQRVVDSLDLTHDPEFIPTPSILDPFKGLFSPSPPPGGGAKPEDIARQNSVDILTRRLTASVLLIEALGGGWEPSPLPPP